MRSNRWRDRRRSHEAPRIKKRRSKHRKGRTRCPRISSARRSSGARCSRPVLALGAMQVASPFVVKALADEPVKIGLDNPLTGTYAALGKNELIGAQLAVDADQRQGRHSRPQGRASGRGLDQRRRRHRGAESPQADRPRQGRLPARQHQLGAGAGDGQVAIEKGVFHIVPGGHTDAVTGKQCHWNVFRVCNTTRMETNSVAEAADQDVRQEVVLPHAGLRLRPCPAARLRGGAQAVRRHRARRRLDAARHHRFFVLSDQGAGGQPRRRSSSCRRATTRSTRSSRRCSSASTRNSHRRRAAGAGSAQRPAARSAHRHWVFEWYWKQPNVPHVAEFVADIRKRERRQGADRAHLVRLCLGLDLRLAADDRRSRSMRSKMAKALQGFELPPEVALMPNDAVLSRRRQPAHADAVCRPIAQAPAGGDPEDLFDVTKWSKASTRRCRSTRPAAR